jgi:hypothetical protein
MGAGIGTLAVLESEPTERTPTVTHFAAVPAPTLELIPGTWQAVPVARP